MRPYEASKRVYLILDADTMNEDAADALLKDLEEPPSYAVIVLLASDLGPLPETIRSRCQLVPFRRLSENAVRAEIRLRAPDLSEEEATTIARVASGRLDRACPAPRSCRAETARDVDRRRARRVSRARIRRGRRAQALLEGIGERGAEAKEKAEEAVEVQELTGREAEQRVRRAQRGAERDELLAALEELEWWYRDLVVLAAGAEGAVVHVDRLDELRSDATRERLQGAERACDTSGRPGARPRSSSSAVPLALEALLVRLRRELAGSGR